MSIDGTELEPHYRALLAREFVLEHISENVGRRGAEATFWLPGGWGFNLRD